MLLLCLRHYFVMGSNVHLRLTGAVIDPEPLCKKSAANDPRLSQNTMTPSLVPKPLSYSLQRLWVSKKSITVFLTPVYELT